MILRVGLTGGLACGKSTVLTELAGCGAATIDDDQLARAALADGSPLLVSVRAALGDRVFRDDGTLDRARVAALVFADAEKRRALEAIVHPEVLRRERLEVARLEATGADIVVADVPLLIEAGLKSSYDRVVAVVCGEQTQVLRATARGMSEADARARIGAQLSATEKARQADYVIDSEGSLDETRQRAREVYARLTQDLTAIRGGDALAPRGADG